MAHTHFIGIGGTGLSAIARVLLERGETVSGSDRADSALAESIRNAGAQVFIGHAADHVRGADVVVRSSAVKDDNVEVVAAKAAGIPVLKRNDYLGTLLAGKFTIGIAGTHGKTTTSSMITWMLHALDRHPGFIVGGEVRNLGVNASEGESDLFVIEADEYDHMFWGLHPTIAVVTNVEHDHPDCYPTERDMMAAFEGFVDRITSDGSLVICLDDPGASHLLAYAGSKNRHWLAYSVDDPDADYAAHNLESVPGAGYQFEVLRGEEIVAKVALRVPGLHNVRNALAAIVTADLLNLDLLAAGEALSAFSGSGRRFEILGEAGGVVVVDDYGHHPTEIAATIQAARARFPERHIWAVWQPHTYSRTTMWQDAFGKAFIGADHVVITGVYAAREVQPEGFSLAAVADGVDAPQVQAIESLDAVTEFLLNEVAGGDVVIVFSAGDATQVSRGVLAELQAGEAAI
ncbi:UDP-N-acetylmuramate--L-alanine ligase [bacterium]|nr:UDP-N-acetylmuramate--L-alanine ligase [bacterium]MCB2179361.1 UDP-N-acetylmuramate--L-alanine ligase [bacterium]